MTRKNFKAIAEVIKTYRLTSLTISTISEELLVRDLVEMMSLYFKQDNPTFDKSKFMRACGWYDE